ncbi:hypothetical protein HW132_12785 [Brasilonema sp. CT11]|nr:hypothetical protein [Brasilonema sp. CT11]
MDTAKTAYAFETIERNAKLQVQIIEDLLDVSRILRTLRALEWLDSGQADGGPTPVKLDIVGHRVVHGADQFTASVLIDD